MKNAAPRTRSCFRRERASPSRAEPSATITNASGMPSTRCARSTRTWSSSMADRPRARNASPPAGPIIARSHKWCSSPIGRRHQNAAPFKRNDRMLEAMPVGDRRLPGQRRHREPRRQGKKARHRGYALRRRRRLAPPRRLWRQLRSRTTHMVASGSSSAGFQRLDCGIPAVPVLEAAPWKRHP